MKKVLILGVFVLTALTTQVNAQKFAIKGGVNFSNMSTTNEEGTKFVKDDRKFLTGWNIGLAAGIDFHENFGFEAELNFNQKGLKYENEYNGILGKYQGTSKTKLVYLDIPVSAKAMFNITKGVQFYGKLGPYVGIGLTGKNTLEVTKDGEKIKLTTAILEGLNMDEGDVEWDKEDKIGSYKRFDYGLQMGLGTEIGGFLIEGIYKFSLGDVDTMDNVLKTKTRNHVLGISVGYNLDFRKFK